MKEQLLNKLSKQQLRQVLTNFRPNTDWSKTSKEQCISEILHCMSYKDIVVNLN